MANILIIDNDKNTTELVSEIAKQNDHNVFSVNTGKKGLSITKKLKPDLIIIDVDLPDMEAPEFFMGMRKQKSARNIPTVIFSNNKDVGNVQQVRIFGVKEFIPKPARYKTINNIFQKYVNSQ